MSWGVCARGTGVRGLVRSLCVGLHAWRQVTDRPALSALTRTTRSEHPDSDYDDMEERACCAVM